MNQFDLQQLIKSLSANGRNVIIIENLYIAEGGGATINAVQGDAHDSHIGNADQYTQFNADARDMQTLIAATNKQERLLASCGLDYIVSDISKRTALSQERVIDLALMDTGLK